MPILSSDGGAINLPKDLLRDASTPDTNKDYFEVTITDLKPNTTYPIQFAWVYEDKTVSDYSATYNVTTESDLVPDTPSAPVLTWGNGYLQVSWDGKNSLGNTYLNYKQVNIWIRKEGEVNSTKSGHFFAAEGFKLIPLGPGTYNIKLQAESMLGALSNFSTEVQSVSYKPPLPVSNVNSAWEIDSLKITFTFNSATETSTNSNAYADYFKITLANKVIPIISRIFYSPVNKSSTDQIFYLTSDLNKSNFGLFTKQFDITIQVVDSFGNTSTTTSPLSSATYSTPLTPPVISDPITPEVLGYSVKYTSPATNLPFDQIYIYESVDNGVTYTQVAQGKANPIRVSTLNTTTRKVKAKFFDSNGESTADSNILEVTPTSPVVADDVAPAAPSAGGISATSTGIDTSGFMGFNGYINLSWSAPSPSDASIRGYRIRFRPYKATAPFENYSYVDAPGTGTTYRLEGLAIGTTYEIEIASYDQFNNTSSSYSKLTPNPQITGTPAISNYITAGAAGFQFGSGIKDLTGSQNASAQGIYLSDSNYWYLTSAGSAQFKVGGSSTNYLSWNGSALAIDGDITARSGQFTGNLSMLGGSIYSGSLITPKISGVVGNGTTATYTTAAAHGLSSNNVVYITDLSNSGFNGRYTITVTTTTQFTASNTTNATISAQTGNIYNISTGYVLNSSGIAFNNKTFIESSTGKLTTISANIGGWDIDSSNITKNGITLNSTQGTIITNNGAFYVGMKPASGNGSTTGTIGTVSGTGPFTATITGMSTTVGFFVGQAITATSGTGNFGSGPVTVTSIISSTSIGISSTSTFTAGSVTNIKAASDIVLWAGQSANGSSANFRVESNGTLRATGAVIDGTFTVNSTAVATSTDLSNGLANKINVAGAAADVNSNTTTISGGKIRAGIIQSTTYTAPSGGNIYSGNGMQIVLDSQGSIISKNFVIDASGNAFFKGEIQAGSGNIANWTIGTSSISKGTVKLATDASTGWLEIGSANGDYVKVSNSGIQIGDTVFASAPFSVTTAGALKATSATIEGLVRVGRPNSATVISATANTSSITYTTSATHSFANGALVNVTMSGFNITNRQITGTTSTTFTVSNVNFDGLPSPIVPVGTSSAGVTGTASNTSLMQFGSAAGGAGNDGLSLGNTGDHIYNNGRFRFGNGIITGTSNSITFNLNVGNSITFSSMPAADDDGWAGDPTITVRDSDFKLTKGRRLIFDGRVASTELPVNPNSLTGGSTITDARTGQSVVLPSPIWTTGTTKTGYYKKKTAVSGVFEYYPVKVGDLLLID